MRHTTGKQPVRRSEGPEIQTETEIAEPTTRQQWSNRTSVRPGQTDTETGMPTRQAQPNRKEVSKQAGQRRTAIEMPEGPDRYRRATMTETPTNEHNGHKQSKSSRNDDDDGGTGATTNKKAVGCGLSGQNAPKWPKCGRATDAETMGQTVQATDRGAATTNGHEWPVDDRDKETKTGTKRPWKERKNEPPATP